jgi:hypothetical protein
MSAINEYPKFKSVNEIPYLHNLQMRLIYAKDFTPHKVVYYEQLIKEFKDGLSNEAMKDILTNNGYKVTTGLHGQIFITPINKGNVYMKSFDSMKQAYNFYITD